MASDEWALSKSRVAIGGVVLFDVGVISAWRVRGRVAGVQKEGDSSVWEGEVPGDVALIGLSIGLSPTGDEADCLTTVAAEAARLVAAMAAAGVLGVVGVMGNEVVAVWSVLALGDRGGLCLDVAVDREASGDVCC